MPTPAPPVPRPAEPQAPTCDRIVRVEVDKGDRRLNAHCANGARIVTTVALGREPLGPKERSGDLRTPEGLYHVAGDLRHSRFYGFIPLDYPSIEDAKRALSAGRLSPRDYERIVDAHRRGELPPADTPLGGSIGLHGEGPRWGGSSQDLDWTFGCLAVADSVLDFLADRLAVGIPVLIVP